MDWLPRITTLDRWHREIAALRPTPDARPGPNPPGSEARLAATEAALGLSLDPAHRDFLAQADGWTDFSGPISLLSADELAGSPLKDRGRRNLDTLSWRALGRHALRRRALLPIAVSDAHLDVVCMPVRRGRVGPDVIWFNNTEPETFDSFVAYVDALLSYQPAALEYARERAAR